MMSFSGIVYVMKALYISLLLKGSIANEKSGRFDK